jgi:hypothetical protein
MLGTPETLRNLERKSFKTVFLGSQYFELRTQQLSPSASVDATPASGRIPPRGATTGPCHGYVIDHIRALKRGGGDAPENMQWQTRAEANAKDRVE